MILGRGHCQHMYGVPERILRHHPGTDIGTLIAYEWEYDCDVLAKDQDCFEGVEMSFGKQKEAADYIYIYEHRQA